MSAKVATIDSPPCKTNFWPTVESENNRLPLVVVATVVELKRFVLAEVALVEVPILTCSEGAKLFAFAFREPELLKHTSGPNLLV